MFEGFFAIQDLNNFCDFILMLDYGIFYEFIQWILLEHRIKRQSV
jgi:hypothetical protein